MENILENIQTHAQVHMNAYVYTTLIAQQRVYWVFVAACILNRMEH